MINPIHVISIIFTMVIVTVIGVYSMKKIKTSGDFAVGGRKVGPLLIAGTVVGSFIGGGATIGTAELAYQVGFSAWWFTLGGGIACLILGLFLSKPLRGSNLTTAPQFLARVYGSEVGTYVSIFTSIGTFFGIVVQILSIIALFSSMFGLGPLTASIIAVILIISYVLFGGVWGTSIIGAIKSALVYVAFVTAGILAYIKIDGVAGLAEFPSYPWFSLFGQGYSTDLAAGFSVIVGILSTQIFIQAMFSAKDVTAARWGTVISAFLIIPTGIAGVLVGLFMRSSYPVISPRDALPLFVLNHMSPWLGGMVWTALFISVIGTAAGLTLGMCTTIGHDIYKKIIRPQASDAQVLRAIRTLIVVTVFLALVFVQRNLNTLILKWSFTSMGLRGATMCLPLISAIFLKGRIAPKAVRAAVIAAPSAVVLWAVFGPRYIDPLYIGLSLSFFLIAAGYFLSNTKKYGLEQ